MKYFISRIGSWDKYEGVYIIDSDQGLIARFKKWSRFTEKEIRYFLSADINEMSGFANIKHLEHNMNDLDEYLPKRSMETIPSSQNRDQKYGISQIDMIYLMGKSFPACIYDTGDRNIQPKDIEIQNEIKKLFNYLEEEQWI